ncbi:disintegrin and metalloproteinase domain-containing protein 20 [Lontra canadensis]|uniref:disintegrin and metalloproteinase domain-containing protein 20 n=1 Tax=Lontra canadensis TaxID=76717 RepID=UPI0013F2E1B2|nr:disintegrin and metalloproteinase domain-containing protein 20 [Lontra canadensis]XP_032693346.1 disintegrin and metalloproteinase domain-containing protein 20 [Lontra canadensis]XP_032693347.1 disintegrin and metalloproteinase domain-containing protein 20 [Lontra canadensis]
MAVGKALVYIRVTLLLLWGGMSLFISGHSQARTSQPLSPELVIPLKVTGRGRGTKGPGWLSYSLQFGGQRYIVHMRVKKLLVSKHFPVFTYTDQHALLQDQPFVPDDCYYHGYVEGIPESLVALSTCSGGFRGMLQINDLAYEIEPMRLSATFEHLVYKMDSDDTQFPPMRCGLTGEEVARHLQLRASSNFTLMQSSYTGWWTHLRFLELVVVVDHLRFLYYRSNVTVVQREVLDIVNIIGALYYPLEVDIILTGIEIWTKRNLVATNNLDQLVEDFSVWKYFNLDARLHYDTAHLFIKKYFGIKLGVAYVGGICQHPFNSGVDVFLGDSLFYFALTVTHELGHNLGMSHDTEECVCGLQWCIMYPSQKMTTRFSNCSYAQYWDNTLTHGLCIQSPPYRGNIFRVQYCGNLVIEEEEECDCGTVRQCVNDPCCLLNCTLKPGATCSFGICCKDCKFMPSGTLCRHQISECDLPEWCNGTFHQCPEDVYLQDGIPCGDDAYCYNGRCNNHDKQCREIFGEDARSASQSCYKEINTQGNRFGHCGITDLIYVKCEAPDILCGRVQCENVRVIPNLVQHSTVHQLHFNNTTCWGTDYHLGMSIPDIGQVKDGTVCGPEKICIHKKCVNMTYPSQDCQTNETCHMHGVCNNKDHCHCHLGWAPPYCKHAGHGGSLDSGPAPGKHMVLPEAKAKLGYLSSLWLIPFTAFILFCFLVLCKEEKKRVGERRGTLSPLPH